MSQQMLFYNQIKREFSNVSWRRGQNYFREERVQNVRLEGDLVVGQVQGTGEAPYEAAIVMARGTIANSKCSCPAHRLYETHCKHVAALGIWVVERGSLLRLGIHTGDYGVGKKGDQPLVLADPEKAKQDVRLRVLLQMHPFLTDCGFIVRRDRVAAFAEGKEKSGRSFSVPVTLVEAIALQEHAAVESEVRAAPEPIPAEPVAFARGYFQNKVLSALTLEPALRYIDPESKIVQVQAIAYLTQQADGSWKSSTGAYLRPIRDDAPIVQGLGAAKLVFQGQEALESLAKVLMSPERKRIVLHSGIDVELDHRPLKLMSMNIGRKSDKARQLTYEFGNKDIRLNSAELAQLSTQGRLSNQFVWKDNKLYKLETSLSRLSQYANRSGVAAHEDGKADFSADGFGSIYDSDDHPLHPLAAYRLSLEMGVENFNVDPEWTEFHEWRKEFEKKKTPKLPEAEYGFQLRDYQKNGLSWMWSLYHRRLAALLADDMGLGKTHQVLALLTSLYRSGSKTRPKLPSLVVAPTSVIAAWSQKLNRYDTHLKWAIFHGRERSLPANGKIDLVLTTYGILQREPQLREREWHMVILDEAQAIKNSSTISSRSSRALKSQFRIAMTGTPVENQSTDLWSLMEFLLPGYLGSLPRFKRLYGSGRDGTSEAQADALKRLISPFLLRRTKTQVLKELPEKTEEVVTCELTPAQRKAYQACLQSAEAQQARQSLEESSKKIDYASILALLTRLKQICDHPRLPDLTTGRIKKIDALKPEDTGKWDTFDELLNEALGSGLKVVVFTQYLGVIDLISRVLKERGIGHTELRGDTPDRAARLDRFARDPECKVFVCSLLAGGLGIDLTAASVCIHFDRWWNPAKENQATDRLHRIGQTRGVQVFKLQIPGTVEDRIAGIIASKIHLSEALVEESALGLKSFSRKELLNLLNPLADPADGAS